MENLYNKASLVLTPQMVEAGKVYSMKPEDRKGDFTFSRSTAATRVNASGNIEKETGNLLTESNNFSDSDWAKVRASVTSGQAGYDGTNDAWAITGTNAADGSASHYLVQTTSPTGVVTLSAYLKANGKDWSRILFLNGSNPRADFNLANGSVHGIAGGAIDANIVDVGSGWYRCSVTANINASSSIYIYASNANNDTNWVGDDTSGILIQDAQLEQGLVARDVITTTTTAIYGGITDNVPRLDYTDSSCPALLLEPQRTNLLPHSEWIGGWSPVNDATIDGPQEFTLGSTSARIQAGSIGSPSGDFVFYAVFDSADIGKTIRLAYFDGTASSWNTGSDITIDSNGRAERLISTGSNVIGNVAFYGTSTSQSFTLKYCQFEAGSYATSYIPTYGSAVTRNADDAEANLTSISETQGTIYWEGFIDRVGQDGHAIAITSSSGGTGSNRILIYRKVTGSNYAVYIAAGNVTQFSSPIDLGVSSTGNNDKIAVAYAQNDLSIYVNGTQVHTSSSGSIPTSMQYVQLNEWNYTHTQKNLTQKALYFPTRLSNEELATLTTIG